MCGIVGGITKNNITPLLVDGLKRLEYRGYDSAGLVVLTSKNILQRVRAAGKVVNLENSISPEVNGMIGIAHTRWATHGKPTIKNAHPHICNNNVGVVHNGIIENFLALKTQQQAQGYHFTSDTDTEVIAHGIHQALKNCDTLLQAVQQAVTLFQGAYGIGAISPKNPGHIIATRSGSPLVIGLSDKGNFIASDQMALLDITKKFIFLEEGDIADITLDSVTIFDKNGKQVEREIKISKLKSGQVSKGEYTHYMQKEIFEQPQAIRDTLESRISKNKVLTSAFGHNAKTIFQNTEHIQIIACGTSYNAGLVAKYWLEDIAKIPTHIEVASEYRYRNPIILDNTLFITISQSGETADTLEALKAVKKRNKNIHSLTICNSAESSLTRESELTFLTHAGPEIGVASTKAFTTQLVSLALLSVAIGRCHNQVSEQQEAVIVDGFNQLPNLIAKALEQEDQIIKLAKTFKDKFNALFLGRGAMHAIAMEGALKLKEISYIHAEAYPAGELKHGPIALIDKDTPVIAIAPNDELLDKLKSNLQEVKSRGSQMIVFEDETSNVMPMDGMDIIPITHNLGRITAPIIFTIPLQLLSYHIALIKGTDVDQPRNLAKSVTVE
ncbi:Glucosamine--fructose-6-phosphate aminotransferase [isomerizing] [Bathymodiolus heckerae thiotrophic gill symbiont]|uniref:glutamine--fructose-6-phosphate transaminase (isomerizing) n=1 Tax=Bathymodiolus heckerae thiotrophic gill symbiont TaxID=1052212 RepID=UPI0010B9D936|nr:glutamine--fructose-6-phosphate transaminase (isomerizing) [Bathymodiolus heckerae thiotrophic gill symbiont]CAC9437414.1 Glutamine--fructose-6-phosphate aminotransferase [isomerizing] (EC 2.6.1.16) [uncultured Gammaproteobacteria bacterium]SMN13497.1 Glucosamine--fructose-6-phosphate aminotransferase [isomerizing] [Bathymodiolus heckerae thiotrophic gill symbiont]